MVGAGREGLVWSALGLGGGGSTFKPTACYARTQPADSALGRCCPTPPWKCPRTQVRPRVTDLLQLSFQEGCRASWAQELPGLRNL